MPPAAPPPPSRPRATGRVTLADVAALAGVSPITVSRTLRGERTVDPVLAARVKEAAQQLRYVPDPAARALASRHGSHVAVLIPMLSNALAGKKTAATLVMKPADKMAAELMNENLWK